MALALIVAVIVFSGLVIYPYLIYPALLRLVPRAPAPDFDPSSKASVTLVFCAYNESRSIHEKMANIERLKAKYPDIEVLAYEDGSSDNTLEVLQSRPDLLTVFVGAGRQGKAHGMKKTGGGGAGRCACFHGCQCPAGRSCDPPDPGVVCRRDRRGFVRDVGVSG